MPTYYAVSFRDNRALGTFDGLQSLIQSQFPNAAFAWTPSGPEKLQFAKERGIELPASIKEVLQSLPSLLEGVAKGEGWSIMFGLGNAEPVVELIVVPQGNGESMWHGIEFIENKLGTHLRVCGQPAVD